MLLKLSFSVLEISVSCMCISCSVFVLKFRVPTVQGKVETSESFDAW